MWHHRVGRKAAFASLVVAAAMISGCIFSSEDKTGTVGDHAGTNTPITKDNAAVAFNLAFGAIDDVFSEPASRPASGSERTIEGDRSGKIVVTTTQGEGGYTTTTEITDFSNDGITYVGGKLTSDLNIEQTALYYLTKGNLAVAGPYKGSMKIDLQVEAFGTQILTHGNVIVGADTVQVYYHPMMK
jgi:hypothetical protein